MPLGVRRTAESVARANPGGTNMSRIHRQLSKPAVATACIASLLLVTAAGYVLLRPTHGSSSTAFPTAPAITGSSSASGAATGASVSGESAGPTSPVTATRPPTSAGGRMISSTPSQSTAPPTGSKVVTWLMQYAPGGTGGMSPLQTYYSFSKGRCGELSEEVPQLDAPFRTLYESAAAACVAAF